VTAFSIFNPRPHLVAIVLLLLIATFLLAATAWQRGAEYDEGYTVFLTAGTPRPDWPAAPFRAGEVRGAFAGVSDAARIARDLRQTDVHPPLYFWSAEYWRRLVGPSLFGLRLLSVAYGVAALAVLAGIAGLAGVPPLVALALTLGSYGFSYTAVVARGFALAQLLTLAGVLLLMLADRGRRGAAAVALAGGLLLGLATFSNYLAVFVAGAALLWLVPRRWRSPLVWLAAGAGFAAVLPADFWFFAAQRGSRDGQFPPFHLPSALARLAQYAAGDVFGGLPLYVTGAARLALGGALAALLLALCGLIAWRWRRISSPGARWLFALAALAPPVGLILLGLVFDNTPIELRYLAFASPFFGLLAAGALASLPRRLGGALAGCVLTVQAASLAGLMLMQQTMQPQAATTRQAAALAGPDGLVIVPRGNDGVGVVGAVLQSAPDWLHLLVVPADTPAEQIRAKAAGAPTVVLALLGLDADSRATLPAMAAAFEGQPCWRPTTHDALVSAFERQPECGPAAGR
jgi:4-amino-4-deoxy-L-arabinose transferase-like glycosyltransferase